MDTSSAAATAGGEVSGGWEGRQALRGVVEADIESPSMFVNVVALQDQEGF